MWPAIFWIADRKPRISGDAISLIYTWNKKNKIILYLVHWTQCVAQIEIIPVWPLTRSNNRIHQWMLWQTWFQLILRIRLKSMTKRMVTTSGSIVYGVHTVKRIHPKGRQIGHLCTNNTHTQKEKREQKWENEIIVLAQIAFMFKSLREKKCEYWVTVIT